MPMIKAEKQRHIESAKRKMKEKRTQKRRGNEYATIMYPLRKDQRKSRRKEDIK